MGAMGLDVSLLCCNAQQLLALLVEGESLYRVKRVRGTWLRKDLGQLGCLKRDLTQDFLMERGWVGRKD